MAASPSPERLRRALLEGDSPVSAVLVRFVGLATLVLLGPSAVSAVRDGFERSLRSAVAGIPASPGSAVVETVALAGPLMAAVAGVALATGLVQTSGVVTWRRSGATQDGRRIYDALRGSVTAVAVASVLVWCLTSTAADLAASVGRGEALLAVAGIAVTRWLRSTLIVLGVAALVDVVAQRAFWKRRWTLSPRDAKRDRKDREGDPQMKDARRRAHRHLTDS